MTLHPMSWWKRDVARNSYIFCQFLIALPFSVFGAYIIYQLQIVGFMVGTDAEGLPCTTYCLVPFGGLNIDLNSVMLYLNALGFGLGGAVMVLLSVYADYLKNKSLLVTIFIALFGAISLPAYWLQDMSLGAFQAMEALWVLYAILTYILMALLNIYIPHCMRQAGQKNTQNISEPSSKENKHGGSQVSTSRRYGFAMSIFGTVANFAAGTVMLTMAVILIVALSGTAAQTAGLLITTITGFVTIFGSVVAFFGLPVLPSLPTSSLLQDWKAPVIEFLAPLKDLFVRKDLLFLLISYTIYTDAVFALYSVTGQIFFVTIKPSALEYSLYTLTQYIFCVICILAFYLVQQYWRPFSFESCLIVGYALILVVPAWGCIGLAKNANFGFKHRWEFYVQLLVTSISGAIANPTFRVLFCELIPQGLEIRWFGLQLILSCATSWVSYIANAPLQNATHQLRFPLLLCLIIFIVPVVLEILRNTLATMKRDKTRWQDDSQESSTGPELVVVSAMRAQKV